MARTPWRHACLLFGAAGTIWDCRQKVSEPPSLTRQGKQAVVFPDELRVRLRLPTVDEARRFGTSNFGRYSDPALDHAIERSAEILESRDRRELLFGIVRKALSEHVWLPLYLDQNVFAVRAPFVYRPRANSFVLAADVQIATR